MKNLQGDEFATSFGTAIDFNSNLDDVICFITDLSGFITISIDMISADDGSTLLRTFRTLSAMTDQRRRASGLLNILLCLIRRIGGGDSSRQDQFDGSFHSLAKRFDE